MTGVQTCALPISALRRFDPAALGRALAPRTRNLVYMAVWTLVFGAMSAAQGVGDRHPGQWLPFWQQACRQGRSSACDFLVARLSAHCADGSGWACNEASVVQTSTPSRESGEPQPGPATATAVESLERGCALGFAPACQNVLTMLNGGRPQSAEPTGKDLPVVLRGSKQGIADQSPSALSALACAQGWPNACAQGDATARH